MFKMVACSSSHSVYIPKLFLKIYLYKYIFYCLTHVCHMCASFICHCTIEISLIYCMVLSRLQNNIIQILKISVQQFAVFSEYIFNIVSISELKMSSHISTSAHQSERHGSVEGHVCLIITKKGVITKKREHFPVVHLIPRLSLCLSSWILAAEISFQARVTQTSINLVVDYSIDFKHMLLSDPFRATALTLHMLLAVVE